VRNIALLPLLSFPCFAALNTPVPLSVTDRSGVIRSDEGITTGVPIPQSANITDVRKLMVTRAATESCAGGMTIDSMLHVVARWNGAPTDVKKPIKWIWVELIGDVAASGTSTYCLADRVGADPGTTAVKVTEDRTFITVATGAMIFRVRKDYFTLLDTVQVHGATLVSSSRDNKWAVTAGSVEYNTTARDGTYSAIVEYPAVKQDDNSSGEPIRAQIRLSGRFTSGAGKQALHYQFRLSAYAKGTSIVMYPTITFSEDCFAFKPTNIVLSLGAQLKDSLTYAFGTSSGSKSSSYLPTDDLVLVQHDHGNGEDGYTINKNGAGLESGTQAPGWIDINDGSGGITAWVRDFWQNYPMALEAKGKILKIHMWPDYDFTRQFNAKRDQALRGTPGFGVIWPSAEGRAMDFTPLAPNSNRIITTVSSANPAVIGVRGFNVMDTGGNGFCTGSLVTTGCNYWPVNVSRRIYISGFADPDWSHLNGYHPARYLGTRDAKGSPQFAIDGLDASQWGTPRWGKSGGQNGLCTFVGQSSLCPQAGSIDSMTDMNATGVAKTWWIKLNFYAGGAVSGAKTAARFADQLMLTNPSWFAKSQAFGRIREVDAGNFPKVENDIIPAAWRAILAKDRTNSNYGTFHWGDTQYARILAYAGEGSRTWAFSRKNWQFVPWLLYARSGDRKYMDYGISVALHGMDVDQPHTTTSFTDANGNVVNKRAGSGPCTHGPTHWYSVYENFDGPGAYSCTEGEQPALDYQTEADSSMYYLLAYDRGKEMLLERANFVINTEKAAGNIIDHIGARNLAGCLQLGLDAYKLTGSSQYLAFAEKCFQAAVKHSDGTAALGNPVGFVQGDRFGNSIDWSYFTSSWLVLIFPEMAEIDSDYCAVDEQNVKHCVRTEFVRFARAMAAMGNNHGTAGVYYYGYPSKTWAYAYHYSADPTFLQFGRLLFTMYTASIEGLAAVYGPNPDVHDWANYLLGLPYAMYALAGQKPGPPDTPAFALKIPSDGTEQTLLVNKAADKAWTFTLSIDTGVDFGGGFFNLAGTVNVNVYDPAGALIQRNTLSACTYKGLVPCIPNSWYPDESNTTASGHGLSVTHGGVDNRVITFSVPADGKTGEYQIKLSAVNHAQNPGGCAGEGRDRFTCYTTTHFAFLMGTSLGNMDIVSPTSTNTQDCVKGSPYAHIGRALLYFNVSEHTSQIQISMSRLNFFLLDPIGNIYKYGSTRTVKHRPGLWAIGTDIGLENGPGPAGYCISVKGVKPLFSQSPQYYYDSPNQSVSQAIRNFGFLTTVNFSR
jgi:hypothetical protein